MSEKCITGRSQCLYDMHLRTLLVTGWALPKAEKIEIWKDNQLIGRAETGIARKDILKQHPEYNEELSGWKLEKEQPEILEGIILVKHYFQNNTVLEDYMKISQVDMMAVGAVNGCDFESDTNCLKINGWFLPKPDKVEIFIDEKKACEAETGIIRKDVFGNWKRYDERYSGWKCKLKKIYTKPAKIEAKAIYNNICRKSIEICKINEKKAPIIGGINKCYYETGVKCLEIDGWYLPKADYVEIFADNTKIGETKIKIVRKDVYNNWDEYNEEKSGWRIRISNIPKKPNKIIVKVYYGEECKRLDETEIIEETDANVIGVVNQCEYDSIDKRIKISGWFLPVPDSIEVYSNQRLLGEAQSRIIREDIFKQFEYYQEKQSGWECILNNIPTKPTDLEVRAVYYGIVQKSINPVQVHSVIEGDLNQCFYDTVLQMLQINGWCLPVPDRVEIWDEDGYLGCAEMSIQRQDVFVSYAKYNEQNSGWQFSVYNLDTIPENVTAKAIYNGTCEKKWGANVEKKIYKVVSFDLFDTLVVRPVAQPTDIFKIIGRRAKASNYFKDMRMYAEKYARKIKSSFRDDISIDEIYESYQTLFGGEEKDIETLKRLEMEVELEYLRPRKSIKEIYQRVITSGTEVIITTDMYLPKEFIEKILKKNGYESYTSLFVSNNENAAKGTGKLYAKLSKIYNEKGIKNSEILHIGDNLRADIAMAKKYGWNTFYIPKTMALFEENKCLYHYAQIINSRLDNGFLIGALANYLFDNPFAHYDVNSYFNGDVKLIGPVLFAPFLLTYTTWMLREIYREKINTVLLAYRDGFLIEKIIRLINKNYDIKLDLIPIYLSRMVRYNSYCQRENGFFEALMDFNVPSSMTVMDFVRNRLLVEENEKAENIFGIFKTYLGKEKGDTINDMADLLPILDSLSKLYNENAEKNMVFINEYCEKLLDGYEKIAVFDVGYRGSVVEYLSKRYDRRFQGYQILSYSFGDKHTIGNENTESYIKYGMETLNAVKILHNLVEDLISAEEGTAFKVSKEKDALIVCKEKFEKKSRNIEIIQNEVIKFIEYFLEMFKKDITELEWERFPEFDFICTFLKNPPIKDAEVIKEMYFTDSNFLGTINQNIYQEWYNSFFENKRQSKDEV